MKALTIAVTGGIGSGKSTVCKYISEKGYQVISCDDVYKELLQNEDFVLKISNKMNVPPIKDKTDAFTRFKRLLERPIIKKFKKRENL